MTLSAELHLDEPQLRVSEADGRHALRAIVGKPLIPARARLRFGPGRTCEAIARLLDRAVVRAHAAGLDPRLLVVADASAQVGPDIVRVRRKAHSVADWIHSPTCHVHLTLRPAGLHATAAAPPPPAAAASPPADLHATAAAPPLPAAPNPSIPAQASAAPSGTSGESAAAVHEALVEVIDPDLGVNVVDLGFVRAVAVEGRTAIITMTLTSAACPLTGVIENQIRTELAPLDTIDHFRIDWQWLPAWRPSDMTDSGRAQLRAIGFTI
jgi:metal-sulfur cluster biosynthetic enzyme/ribosomal protein L22